MIDDMSDTEKLIAELHNGIVFRNQQYDSLDHEATEAVMSRAAAALEAMTERSADLAHAVHQVGQSNKRAERAESALSAARHDLNRIYAALPKLPRCRECADHDGRCPSNDVPCDPVEHAIEIMQSLSAANAECERLRKLLEQARNQVVAFAIDTVGADVAVSAVKYIDDALLEKDRG